MTTTSTYSASETYTTTDIATVIRRFTADIVMIAQSSGAITEKKATQYTVNNASGDLSMSRPGGVRWPQVNDPYLRIILSYTSDYGSSEKESMNKKLKINWTPTSDDTSHSSLKSSGSRDYAKNGWGMQRKDFAA